MGVSVAEAASDVQEQTLVLILLLGVGCSGTVLTAGWSETVQGMASEHVVIL